MLNRLEGQGAGHVQTRIVSPDRTTVVTVSDPSLIDLSAGGYMFDMVFLGNLVFPEPGTYWVQLSSIRN